MLIKVHLNDTDLAMEQGLKLLKASGFRLPTKDVMLLWQIMNKRVPYGPLQQADIRPMRQSFCIKFVAAVDICMEQQRDNILEI
eukprot:12413589-Karenia_brevis.AAC.1